MDLDDLTSSIFKMPPADRDGPADNCPTCLHRGNRPHHTADVPRGVQCLYTCASCDYEWSCAWFTEGRV